MDVITTPAGEKRTENEQSTGITRRHVIQKAAYTTPAVFSVAVAMAAGAKPSVCVPKLNKPCPTV